MNRLKALWVVLTAKAFVISPCEGKSIFVPDLNLSQRADLDKTQYLKQSLSKPPRKRKK